MTDTEIRDTLNGIWNAVGVLQLKATGALPDAIPRQLRDATNRQLAAYVAMRAAELAAHFQGEET